MRALQVLHSDINFSYRYTYNGKELDKEGLGGGGATFDYGFRIYNAQIAKFLSVDPLYKSYPWNSTYAYAENDVMSSIDLDGLEKLKVTLTSFAPFDYFGGGFVGNGDDATFKSKTTKYKLRASTILDVSKNTVSNTNAGKVPTVWGPDIKNNPYKAVSDTKVETVSTNSKGQFVLEASAGNDAAMCPVLFLGLFVRPIVAAAATPLLRDIDISGVVNMNVDLGTKISYSIQNKILKVSGNIYGDKFPAGQATLEDETGNSIFLQVSPIDMKEAQNKEVAPWIMLYGKGDKNMGTFDLTIKLGDKNEFLSITDNKTGITYNSVEEYNKQFEKTEPVKN
jgi:RHS repeat-associated protein